MIAAELMSPDLSQAPPRHSTAAIAKDDESSGLLPAGKPATLTVPFQPLDPGIVSATIPAFFIGRNGEGFWIARDANGQIGGIFLLENSALLFARSHSRPAGCATIYPSARIELDLENSGSPLVAQLASLMRLMTRLASKLTGIAGR